MPATLKKPPAGSKPTPKRAGGADSKNELAVWAFTWNATNATEGDLSGLPSRKSLVAFLSQWTDQWCFQHERVSRDHYQGRLKVGKAMFAKGRCKKFALLDFFRSQQEFEVKGLTLSPESNKGIKNGGNGFYVMKFESRVQGPWHDPSFKPRVVDEYKGADMLCMKQPFTWQREVMRMAKEPWNDRHIHWIWDADGKKGKSKLFKFMSWPGTKDAFGDWFDFNAKVIPLGNATQIKTAVIAGGMHKAYLVDLPRVRGKDEALAELFSAIEGIKNGHITSAMYGKDQKLFMMPAHVFVVSNDCPRRSVASVDRWKTYKLVPVAHETDSTAENYAMEEGDFFWDEEDEPCDSEATADGAAARAPAPKKRRKSSKKKSALNAFSPGAASEMDAQQTLNPAEAFASGGGAAAFVPFGTG